MDFRLCLLKVTVLEIRLTFILFLTLIIHHSAGVAVEFGVQGRGKSETPQAAME